MAETTRELSIFADFCIDAVLGWLYHRQCQDMGRPRNSEGELQHLVVIGMGKLGAYELNLSSDVERGKTVGCKTKNQRDIAFFLALIVFGFIVSVAYYHHPLGILLFIT